MNTLFLSLVLILGPASVEEPDSAQELYQKGSVKFDSADYDGAIEDFTKALAIVNEQGLDDHARLRLLFNIAAAHEEAYEIDREETHLRQARTLYQRYLNFARDTGNLEEELDVEARILGLERKLKEHKLAEQESVEREEEPQAPQKEGPPPPPTEPIKDEDVDWEKPRRTGIGLVVAGSTATVGGLVLTVVGSQLEPRAQNEVSKLEDANVPTDHPAWDEADDFIAQEKRKGGIMMGVGASVAIVGAVGVGVGSYYLVKSKRLKESRVSATPTFAPGFAGVQISGKF